MKYFAHTALRREDWEPLALHLTRVADRAAAFAEACGAVKEARIAGLLHDLGKYSELFHRRLAGDPGARCLDHWSLGAWAALRRSTHAALAIQGHHVGLQVGDLEALRGLDPRRLSESHPQEKRLTEANLELLLERFHADGLSLPEIDASSSFSKPPIADMLDTRMVFSALVDADNLETEHHFRLDQGRPPRASGPSLDPHRAVSVLDAHFEAIERRAHQDGGAGEVARMRTDLRRVCESASTLPPGLFTLSAPTGAGKTLAMLSFALRHAAEHGLRRIVTAIPFLAIIEQTAAVYRDLFEPIFGDEYVLEHHSLVANVQGGQGKDQEEDEEHEAARLRARELCQNWDAPLIATTNVQLLHSLFANQTQPCRKLHRLAKSVLLFDEVQTLPKELVVPTLGALSRLTERYGATIVFATATQPAFDQLHEAVSAHCVAGWRPREIVPDELGLFRRLNRVDVHWNHKEQTSWTDLAAQIGEEHQALCIVNLKRHAKMVVETLRAQGMGDVFHLSTNLCAAHRERVLEEVRRRLRDDEPCRLISTQCVEAGVDIDFPALWRALGPLEAMAQAAGRCNRHGRFEVGVVRIFLPEEEKYPTRSYKQAVSATKIVLKARGVEAIDLQDPGLYHEYYRTLYAAAPPKDLEKEIQQAIEDRHFAHLAERYQLIKNDTVNVLVPYDADVYDALRKRLEKGGKLTRDWIHRARPHAVALYRPSKEAEIRNILDPAPLTRGQKSKDWFVFLGEYDEDLGVVKRPDLWIA